MSDAFQPSLTALARTGVAVQRGPYSDDRRTQQRQSLELMSQKIREGYKDGRVKARAAQVLRAAGIDGRERPTVRAQVQALYEYVVGAVDYMPDPVKTEYVQSAVVTLCLAPGLCIAAGDCDDLTVVLCCLILAAGIPCWIVKEDYASLYGGPAPQSHVLVGFRDEQGRVLFVCPSEKKGIEETRMASNRQFVDPLATAPIEIVGVGRPHVHGVGLAAPADTTQAGNVTLPGTWTNVPSNAVEAGLRYAVAIVGVPTAGWGIDDVKAYFSAPDKPAANLGSMAIGQAAAGGLRTAGPTFLVEQVIPSASQSFVMIGVARQNGTVPATTPEVNVVAVLQEQSPATGAVAGNTAPIGTAPLVTTNSVGFGTALVWGAGIALGGGILYALYKRGHLRR